LLDVPVDDAQWERLDPAQRRTEILDAGRRLLLREAQVQALLVVFEDLHWIDSETQAFLDALVESLPSVRVLLLTNYRPEYRHRWGAKSYYTQIRVDPLPPESAGELLDALLGTDAALVALRRLLIERTARNPLFMEESVRALVETGVLAGSRGAYGLARPVDGLEVPATVQAVLAARIDRLEAEDKRLLQAASVIGKDVPFLVLQEIADLTDAQLRERLAALQEAEFLYEASLFPELEYTFKHALTHDVAYHSVLHERRKALHAKILRAMERVYTDRLVEHLERLGHHAFLGEIWDEALSYLKRAAEKAVSRSANRTAIAAFEQALLAAAHLPQTQAVTEQSIDIHLSTRLALTTIGELARSLQFNREAVRLAESIADKQRLPWALGAMTVSCGSAGSTREAVDFAERMAATATEVQDPLVGIAADFYRGWAYSYTGHFDEAIELLMRCAAHTTPLSGGEEAAAESGKERRPRFATPAYLRVNALSWKAACLADIGRFDDAIQSGRDAVFAAEELGLTYFRARRCTGLATFTW
jgi:predicted ATPase